MATKPAAGDYYIVPLVNTANALDIKGGDMGNGANVQTYTRNNTDAQCFRLTYRDNGSLQITNRLNGKSLDIPQAEMYSNANVQMWTDNDTRAQEWDLKDYGETVTISGTVYNIWGIFLKQASSLYMDVAAASTASGANVQIHTANNSTAQKWAFVPVPIFKSGGVYEIRSMLSPSLVLDVAGASTADGANVQLYKANDTPAQKFVLVDEGDGWSVRNIASNKYMDVADANFAAGTNVQSYSDTDTRQQRWHITQYNTTTINGKTCQIVRFGAGNADDFCLDVEAALAESRTNVQLWTANNTNAQMWALYPTNAVDNAMPTPYGLGLAEFVGGKIAKSVATTGSNGALSKKVIPAWYSADAWATSGSNSFQWRWRSRSMSSSKSTWGAWGNYTSWLTALVTRDGNRYDVTEGIDIAYNLGTTKAVQLNIEVKACGVNEYSLLTGPTVSETLSVHYKPQVMLSNGEWTKDGLQFDYSCDYRAGNVNVFFTSISHDGAEYLSGEYKAVIGDDATSVTVPVSKFATIPPIGVTLSVSIAVGTDQYDRFGGITTFDSVTYAWQTSQDLPVTITDGSGYTQVATVQDVGSVQMWVVMADNMFECDRISEENGYVGFMVPYPFGVDYRLYASGYSSTGDVWYSHMENFVGPTKRIHAWNVNGIACVLECREAEVLATEHSIDAVYEELNLNSRRWKATTFAIAKTGKFTVEGAVVPGVTESYYPEFEKIVGKHALFRSMSGDISKVAVVGVKRTTKTSYTTITVTMNKEDF